MVSCLLQLSVVINHRIFDAAHNPDPDLGEVPDACSRPDLTLPSRMTPFIEDDLSPLPVSVQEL